MVYNDKIGVSDLEIRPEPTFQKSPLAENIQDGDKALKVLHYF
jgi:hypothetical protein